MEEEFLEYLDTLNGSQQKKSLAWLFFMHKKLNQRGSIHQALDFNILINGVRSKGFDNLVEERILKAFETFRNGKTSRSVIQNCFGMGPTLPKSKGLKKGFLTQSQLKKKRELYSNKKFLENQSETVLTKKRKTVGQQRDEVIIEHENNRKNKSGVSNKIVTQKKKNKQLSKFYRSKIQNSSIKGLLVLENEIKEKVKNESLVKNLQDFIKQKINSENLKNKVEKEPKTHIRKNYNSQSFSEKEEFLKSNFNPPKEKIFSKLFNSPTSFEENEGDPLHRK